LEVVSLTKVDWVADATGSVRIEFNVGKGLAVVGCIGMEGILSLVLIDGTVGIGRAEKLLRGETGFAFQLEVEFT
jgi:hypothetical protein